MKSEALQVLSIRIQYDVYWNRKGKIFWSTSLHQLQPKENIPLSCVGRWLNIYFNVNDGRVSNVIDSFEHIHTCKVIDLVSHTTYVMCVNFIHKWRDLQFKVDSERQIFEKLFHGNFIYPHSFCQKSVERKSPKKCFTNFALMTGPGLEPWLFV